MKSRNSGARRAAPDIPAAPPPQHDISEAPPAPPEATSKNSLLNFIQPTEFVQLPTGGRFYPEGHPLCNQDSIEISMMTAKEEDILTNQSLIKKGVAINKMIQSLLVDKNIDPRDLFLGDKNALVVATRISAYGASYEINITCPECGHSQTCDIDLEEVVAVDDFNMQDGIEMNDRNNFVMTLPKTGIVAEVRLLNGHDGVEDIVNKKHFGLISLFKKFVVSLNNITDRKMINEFLEMMPASDSRFLREAYSNLVPNIDMTQDFECDVCAHEQTMEVPLSADFFWPRS